LATSVTSARVGRGEFTIESSICVAVITGRASSPAIAITRFWTIGTSSSGSSTPRSPARDHHAVGGAHDLLGPLDRLRLLDLRDQRQSRPRAHHLNVLRPPHERQGDHVHADLLAEGQHVQVALGHGGEVVQLAGHVDALTRRDGAARLDDRVELAVAHSADRQPHRAVGQEDVLPDG